MRRQALSGVGVVVSVGIALGVLGGCGAGMGGRGASSARTEWMRVPAKVVSSTPSAVVLEDQGGARLELAAADVELRGAEVFVRRGGRLPSPAPDRGAGTRGLGQAGLPPPPPVTAVAPPPTSSPPQGASAPWGCALFIKFACGSNEIIGVCSHSVTCNQP